MKHRLIIHSGTEPMTREEMRDYLEAIEFTIPVVAPVAPLQMPERYTGLKILITNGRAEYHPDYLAYLQARSQAADAYNADMERYRQDLADIEAILSATFTGMETYERTGNNPDGTAKWDWVEHVPPLYKHSQCALVFAGPKRPADVIGFICNGYFGS